MWPNPQETTDLDTFTEKILNGKLHFLCSANHEPGWISMLYSSYGIIQSSSKYVLCLEPATLLNIAFRIDKNFATFSKEPPSNTMIYRIIIAEYAWWVDAIFFIGIPGLLCKPQSLKFSMAQLNIYRSLLRNLWVIFSYGHQRPDNTRHTCLQD